MATNPGTTGLVSWWGLNETAPSNALDSHGTNELVETSGTIGSTAGLVGGCRDFELGDSEYFSIPSNASLVFADEPLTVGAWVNLESKADPAGIMGKYNTANKREYLLTYTQSVDRFLFYVSATGTATVVATASVFGAPGTAAWLFVVGYHDPTANTIGISVNAGAETPIAHTTGIFSGTTQFNFGNFYNSGVSDYYLDGKMDEAFLYRRVLTADEISWLYNSGVGRAYSELIIPSGHTQIIII